jgi:cytochrome c heme-lyase
MGAAASAAPPPAPCAGAAAAAGKTPDGGTPVYDVYGRRVDATAPPTAGCPVLDSGPLADIDPANNMPRTPNQAPCAGQRAPLSTARAVSTIPKAGVASTWTYPSPQMFFNALRRKGKGGDVVEGDVESVVAAHNGMNEATWARVLAWEAMHASTCPGGPRLTRFLGRPHDTSPLARLASFTGKPLPFDRHDWYVNRCGRDVRYVIDFYYDEAKAGTPGAFELRVRPAIDTPGAALDRLKMGVYRAFHAAGLPCPLTGTAGGIAAAADGKGGGERAAG